MSHKSLAAIWIQLETRNDIDNILSELIGQHVLNSSALENDFDELLNASLHLAVLFKVIFDLQRTYSQDSKLLSESPRLLNPSKLFLAIIYLLRVKSRAFCQLGDTSEQYVAKRSLIAQALVSGLRALWLRKYPLTQDQKSQLQNTFDGAWQKDKLSGLDLFLIQTLCSKIVKALTEGSDLSSVLSDPACREAKLRNYSTGLYPLESRQEELIGPVQKASSCNHSRGPEWFRSFWVLFDITWATEAALIQLCINFSRTRDGAKFAPPTQDDINQLHSTRKRVLETVLGSQTIDPVIKDAIVAVLLAQCFLGNCSCLSGQSTQSDYSDITSTTSSSIEAYKRGKLNNAMSQFLDESLASIAKALEYRKEELRDCNKELSEISESLNTSMDNWYSNSSGIGFTTGSSRVDWTAAYILPCPKLHPLPYEILRGLIVHSAEKVGLSDLEKNSSYFQVDISCCECKTPYPVKWVRQVEPLRHLSFIIKEKLERKPLSRPKLQRFVALPDPFATDSSADSPELIIGSPVSNSTSLSDKNSLTKGSLTDIFDEFQKQSTKSRSVISYCFAADGQNVLLWTRYGSKIVIKEIASGEVKKFDAQNINFTAAGGKLYGVISSSINGRHRNLNIYKMGDGDSVNASLPPITTSVFCIAFSRNDKFVALAVGSEVWIYAVENQQNIQHSLPPAQGSRMESQRVSFSADSENFIVATRYIGGNIYTYISSCTRPDLSRTLPHVKAPTDHGNDFGLTSVLYDNQSKNAYITAFTRKMPPVLFSPQNPTPQFLDKSYHNMLGNRIQCAAQCPSGNKLVLVNDESELFSVRTHPDTFWHVEKMKIRLGRTTIMCREDLMAIAMPDEDTIHLFWIKGAEWWLMTA